MDKSNPVSWSHTVFPFRRPTRKPSQNQREIYKDQSQRSLLNSIHDHIRDGLDNPPTILYWEILINRIGSSCPQGVYTKPLSPVAIPLGVL